MNSETLLRSGLRTVEFLFVALILTVFIFVMVHNIYFVGVVVLSVLFYKNKGRIKEKIASYLE